MWCVNLAPLAPLPSRALVPASGRAFDSCHAVDATGKSYICELMPGILAANDPGLNVVSLSLDDLYSTHNELVALAQKHSTNKLLQGRGPPGTHDLNLGLKVLSELAAINDQNDRAEDKSVELPIFEKALFGGQGDRSPLVKKVQGPVDIVLFEGWMLGFLPLSQSKLVCLYQEAQSDPAKFAAQHLDYADPFLTHLSLDDVETINAYLSHEGYRKMWEYCTAFVQLRPLEMGYTWDWRLEVSLMLSLSTWSALSVPLPLS